MSVQPQKVDEQIIKTLFLGVAPEQHEELAALWEKYGPVFLLRDDADGVVMEAGAFREVHFTPRTLHVLWVSAFASWEAYRCEAQAVVDDMHVDTTRLRELLDFALAVRDSADPWALPLPGIPVPGEFPDAKTEVQMRAATELATFAGGWAMLHEVRHIQHQQDGTSSTHGTADEQRAEELSCDGFATRFILDRLHDYAAQSGEVEDKVRTKRTLGIYFAVIGILVLGYPKWGQSESHPSVQVRFDALRALIGGDALATPELIVRLALNGIRRVWPNVPFLLP